MAFSPFPEKIGQKSNIYLIYEKLNIILGKTRAGENDAQNDRIRLLG